MVNLIIPTDEQTFAALKRLAEAKQVSIEELTYQLLTDYVEQHPYSEESWPSVGLFASGVKAETPKKFCTSQLVINPFYPVCCG